MNQDNTITLYFNEEELVELYQSDERDDSPEDLTIMFDRKHIDQSKFFFEQCPDLHSVHFDACILSDTFEGKIRQDRVIFHNTSSDVYLSFENEYSANDYSMCITEKLKSSLKEHSERGTKEDTEEHVFCVHFGSDYQYLKVPKNIVRQGENAMTSYIFDNKCLSSPHDLDVLHIDYVEKAES